MNHFFNRKSDGTFTYIYYDAKNASLSMKRYSKRGVKSNVTLLRQNIEKDFACAVDKNGIIHVAFSSVNGGIHYGYFTENSFKSFQILSAKSHMNYNKHLMISASANPVCIFYMVRHNGKNIFSMQNVNCEENTSSSPTALDYISDPDIEINLCENVDGNIFIAYPKTAGESCVNVIREVTRDGTSVNIREYLTDILEPLSVDSIYFEDEKIIKLMAHPITQNCLYILTFDSKIIVEKIDIMNLPKNNSTFYSLVSIYGKLYCYMYSEGGLYSCILRGGSTSVSLERQTRQYGSSIFPIHCCINGMTPMNFILPGNLNSGQFFYIFNPFSDIKTSEEVMDLSKIANIEKRLSAIEKFIQNFDSNK